MNRRSCAVRYCLVMVLCTLVLTACPSSPSYELNADFPLSNERITGVFLENKLSREQQDAIQDDVKQVISNMGEFSLLPRKIGLELGSGNTKYVSALFVDDIKGIEPPIQFREHNALSVINGRQGLMLFISSDFLLEYLKRIEYAEERKPALDQARLFVTRVNRYLSGLEYLEPDDILEYFYVSDAPERAVPNPYFSATLNGPVSALSITPNNPANNSGMVITTAWTMADSQNLEQQIYRHNGQWKLVLNRLH